MDNHIPLDVEYKEEEYEEEKEEGMKEAEDHTVPPKLDFNSFVTSYPIERRQGVKKLIESLFDV